MHATRLIPVVRLPREAAVAIPTEAAGNGIVRTACCSTVLGPARLAFGGLAAPLVGLGGSGIPVPLGMVTVACGTLAVIVYAIRLHARVAEQTVTTGRPIDRVTANS
jgi:MFS transporter, DHA1 family, multidrug resistance protein